MKNLGIICEYNPFHNGHAKQIGMFERTVCLMSGNYVQRGEPAIVDKYIRAQTAVACGASLVLELPITCAISSAEGFASGAVSIFRRLGCVDAICFGSESGDINNIMSTAKILCEPSFGAYLRAELEKGVSFPAAREMALSAMGADASLLVKPNDILAVEYCKAILSQNAHLEPITVKREGDYHGGSDVQNPSASFLRTQESWEDFMPAAAWDIFCRAPRHSLSAGEKAWLARLRSVSEAEFEQVPYGSEGLWRKLMRACREQTSLEQIIEAVKSKRYTRTRIMRMLLCAFLGITEQMLQQPAPYVRVLAFDDVGRTMLRQMRDEGSIPLVNAGQMPPDAAYWELERRASDLYGLFREDSLGAPAQEQNARVFYKI